MTNNGKYSLLVLSPFFLRLWRSLETYSRNSLYKSPQLSSNLVLEQYFSPPLASLELGECSNNQESLGVAGVKLGCRNANEYLGGSGNRVGEQRQGVGCGCGRVGLPGGNNLLEVFRFST